METSHIPVYVAFPLWCESKLVKMVCSGPLTPRFANNDYVTAEITYSTAHEPLVALHMSIMRYWLGHGLVSGLPLYELCHESTGCCCTGATLECILVMQSEFILRLRYGYLMVILCPLLWLLRRDAVLWLPCQPGENKSVCHSYGSFSLLPAS